jgi:hypothetical protein
VPVFENKQAEKKKTCRRRAARKLNTQNAKHNFGIAKAHQILAYYTRTSPVTPAHRLHVACTLPARCLRHRQRLHRAPARHIKILLQSLNVPQ